MISRLRWVNHLADASRECKGREFRGTRDYVSQLAKMSLPNPNAFSFLYQYTLHRLSFVTPALMVDDNEKKGYQREQ
jgi:hypothetical protein